MSLDTLLQAAAFIERRDRGLCVVADTEHGYASTAPCPIPEDTRKSSKSRKALGSRTTHNELEKNRRAHLRQCLEMLKNQVPLGPEASRHTTLGLLTRAKRFIKSLEDKDRRNSGHKETLHRHNRYLRRRLESLSALQSPAAAITAAAVNTALSKRRSLSESSSTTFYSFSTNSSASPYRSESDEVDVIGYSSNQSDSDDHSSVQSSSDSGVIMSTSRLSLLEPITRQSI